MGVGRAPLQSRRRRINVVAAIRKPKARTKIPNALRAPAEILLSIFSEILAMVVRALKKRKRASHKLRKNRGRKFSGSRIAQTKRQTWLRSGHQSSRQVTHVIAQA